MKEHDEARRCWFGPHASPDHFTHGVNIEVNERGLWTEDQHTWNEFVVGMAFTIRKTACAWDAPEISNMWSRGGTEQLDERNHRTDHYAVQQARG